MKKHQFKTTLKCAHCVAKIKGEMDMTSEILNWSVDLKSQDRILTVETEHEGVTEKVVQILSRNGFGVELIS